MHALIVSNSHNFYTVSPVEELITEKDWTTIFPDRWYVSPVWKSEYNSSKPWFYPEMNIDYYSYENFVAAVGMMREKGYANFLNEPGATKEQTLQELCAFLSNIGHDTGCETSWLFYREQLDYERTDANIKSGYYDVGSRTEYRMSTAATHYRAGTRLANQVRFTSASYHGRGPLQLSWGYNYGDFSEAMYGDPQVLLEDPDRLLDDPIFGMASAIWFWMTQPDWRPTHNAHKCMYKHISTLQPWGFGRTIMAINGGLEGNTQESGSSDLSKKVARRINNYRRFAAHFEISIGIDGEQLDTFGFFN